MFLTLHFCDLVDLIDASHLTFHHLKTEKQFLIFTLRENHLKTGLIFNALLSGLLVFQEQI